MAVKSPRPRRHRRWPAVPAAVLAAISLAACTTGSVGSGDSSAPGPTGTATAPSTPAGSDDTGGPSGPGTLPAGPTTDTGASSPSTAGSGDAGPSAPATGAVRTVPVQITISDWNAAKGQAEVDAFVPGAVISGGTCTLTLTRGGTHRQAEHSAVTTPSSTSCGLITIARSRLAPGDWQAVVRFQAPTATGASDPVTITVPA